MKNYLKTMVFFLMMFIMLAGVTSCEKEENPTIKKIDEVVDTFINKYATTYFDNHLDTFTMEFHVALAINEIAKTNSKVKMSNYLDKSIVETYYQNLEYHFAGEAFKAITNCLVMDTSYDKAKTFMADLKDVDPWNITYALLALNKTNNNETLKESLLNKVTIINPEDYRDSDYAGIALVATKDEKTLDKTNLFNLITPNLTSKGVNSWGNVNACSTAYVILGLIASGIDPTSSDYTIEGTNLIEALLGFYQEGAFKNTLDGEIDLAFATPQAILALVTYKAYYSNHTLSLI